MQHLHKHPLQCIADSLLLQKVFGLSGSFLCGECGKLRYGPLHMCVKCSYRVCGCCVDEFQKAYETAVKEVEVEQEAVRLAAARRRQKKEEAAHETTTAVDSDGLNSFTAACLQGDLEVVKDRVERNEFLRNLDIEAVVELGPHRGRTPLLLAAQHGHQPVVSFLLSRGADPETIDNDGMTPLMHAAFKGHLGVLNELLFANVSVDRVAFCGYTALLLASTGGHLSCIRRLLASGAKATARTPNGRTALIVAAFNGHFNTVQHFVENDSQLELSQKDDEGYTSLMAAVSMKHTAVDHYLRTVSESVQ